MGNANSNNECNNCDHSRLTAKSTINVNRLNVEYVESNSEPTAFHFTIVYQVCIKCSKVFLSTDDMSGCNRSQIFSSGHHSPQDILDLANQEGSNQKIVSYSHN